MTGKQKSLKILKLT